MSNTQDKVVVITGASSGLGEATDPGGRVARAVAYAIEQLADVDINEILLRPTAQKP